MPLRRFRPVTIVCLAGLAACIALALPAPAHAWPAAIQMGSRIRVTSSALGDSIVTGTFVRHDDSTLTFNPENSRHGTRVRFADIPRLEADTNPTREAHYHGWLFALLGGAVGYGLGAGLGQHSIIPAAYYGAIGAIPGLMLGGIVDETVNGGTATDVFTPAWLEIPRNDWANGFAIATRTLPDSLAGRVTPGGDR